MQALNLDQIVDEIIPRDDSNTQASSMVDLPLRPSFSGSDDVTTALALVSEAAASIRQLEQQSVQAVARAHNAANAVTKKLERSETRAERAEMALSQATAEIAELTAAGKQVEKDIEILQSGLAAKKAELAAIEQRAVVAERRADEAEAAIRRIVTAIRTQLPLTSLDVAAEQADDPT